MRDLEKLGKLLLAIREEREEKLENYKLKLSKFHQPTHAECEEILQSSEPDKLQILSFSIDFTSILSKERRALLALELPFEIDTLSVNRGLMTKEKFSKVKHKPVDRDELTWIHEIPDNSICYERQSLINFLKREGIYPKASFNGGPPLEIPFEDFVHDLPYQIAIQGIKACSTISEGTKEVYLSRAREMRAFVRKTLLPTDKLLSSHEIDLYALAQYFDYLEQRCLNSYKKRSLESARAYRDLLAVRLLFYTSLPSEQLSKITLADIHSEDGSASSFVIRIKNKSFPVPATFVELANSAIANGDVFVDRDVKTLYKFITQTAVASKCLAKITPTALRRSLKSICSQQRFCTSRLSRR